MPYHSRAQRLAYYKARRQNDNRPPPQGWKSGLRAFEDDANYGPFISPGSGHGTTYRRQAVKLRLSRREALWVFAIFFVLGAVCVLTIGWLVFRLVSRHRGATPKEASGASRGPTPDAGGRRATSGV